VRNVHFILFVLPAEQVIIDIWTLTIVFVRIATIQLVELPSVIAAITLVLHVQVHLPLNVRVVLLVELQIMLVNVNVIMVCSRQIKLVIVVI
jgi:hypothetical protein